jgi:hypothetical protein
MVVPALSPVTTRVKPPFCAFIVTVKYLSAASADNTGTLYVIVLLGFVNHPLS